MSWQPRRAVASFPSLGTIQSPAMSRPSNVPIPQKAFSWVVSRIVMANT